MGLFDPPPPRGVLAGVFAPDTLGAYRPTLRDRIAGAMAGDARSDSLRYQLTEGLLGGVGVGQTRPGAIDFTPAGLPFMGDEAGRKMANGRPVGAMADIALGVVPLPAAAGALRGAGKKVAKTVEGAVEKVAPKIIGYHGSPHTFEKFDTAKIGTGEGAQAYGRGLYFAENEATAKTYRDALTPPGAAGSMYEVGIGAHPDHLLDWDQTLDRQTPHVRDALAGLLKDDSLRQSAERGIYDARGLGTPYDPRTGEKVYRALGSKHEATTALREAGIPGIKYLDSGSRGSGGGTRNFVVFDPKHIEILKRYGITATALSGGAVATRSGPKNQTDRSVHSRSPNKKETL